MGLFGCFILLFLVDGFAQNLIPFKPIASQGDFYFYWGYNRSKYTLSDIHLSGDGYAFTLHKVRAKDDPEPFDADTYLRLRKFTIPQFNIRVGYFLNDKYSLSLGWDHMKYVLVNNEFARIEGFIEESASEQYAGTYSNQHILVEKQFLQYEHTDGLNYIRLQLNRHDNLIAFKNVAQLNAINGLGIAAVAPWTDAVLFRKRYRNRLHLGGFGFNASSELQVMLWNHFFVQYGIMGGYVNLKDVTVNINGNDRAQQTFWFFENHFVAGGQFPIGNKKVRR